jgi:cell division GTPase FtsZ
LIFHQHLGRGVVHGFNGLLRGPLERNLFVGFGADRNRLGRQFLGIAALLVLNGQMNLPFAILRSVIGKNNVDYAHFTVSQFRGRHDIDNFSTDDMNLRR